MECRSAESMNEHNSILFRQGVINDWRYHNAPQNLILFVVDPILALIRFDSIRFDFYISPRRCIFLTRRFNDFNVTRWVGGDCNSSGDTPNESSSLLS